MGNCCCTDSGDSPSLLPRRKPSNFTGTGHVLGGGGGGTVAAPPQSQPESQPQPQKTLSPPSSPSSAAPTTGRAPADDEAAQRREKMRIAVEVRLSGCHVLAFLSCRIPSCLSCLSFLSCLDLFPKTKKWTTNCAQTRSNTNNSGGKLAQDLAKQRAATWRAHAEAAAQEVLRQRELDEQERARRGE